MHAREVVEVMGGGRWSSQCPCRALANHSHGKFRLTSRAPADAVIAGA